MNNQFVKLANLVEVLQNNGELLPDYMGHILEDNTVFIGVRTSNPACNISE
jgi:hypothetical protein